MSDRNAYLVGLNVLAASAASAAMESACIVPEGAVAGDLTLTGGTYTSADGAKYAADFGTLIVPENRNASESNLIALPVIRVRATGAHPAEPVFWLSGGPGSSNMQASFSVAMALDRPSSNDISASSCSMEMTWS